MLEDFDALTEPLEGVNQNSRDALKANILVVEDKYGARKELKELLEGRGYRVRQASSGANAINSVKQLGHVIDIILMDIKMPGQFDGIDASSIIQKTNRGIPILYLTAFSQNEEYRERVKRHDLRIKAWIDKPILGNNKLELFDLIDQEFKKKLCRNILEQLSNKKLDSYTMYGIIKKVIDEFGLENMSAILDDIDWIHHKNRLTYRDLSFWANVITYKKLIKQLSTHSGEYVAIHNCQVIEIMKSRGELRKALRNQYYLSGCLIQKILPEAESEPIILRRPYKVMS